MAVPNPPTIELPPTPPQRSDPTNFPARGDAFMTWFVTAWNYLSTLVPWMTSRANEVQANADTVAANAIYVASTANYKGLWSALTGALNMPATVSHNGRFWQLNQNLANVATAQPGVSAAWTDAVGTNVPTATIGNASTTIANTDFVQKTVGGVLNKSVAGGANVTLTATEAGYGTLNLTGAITANIDVIVPATPTRAWIVDNNTTGNFTLRVKTAAGAGVYIPVGRSAFLYSNGTDVLPGDDAYVEKLGMRNRIINGNFDVWQRGTTITPAVASVRAADMWIVYSETVAPANIGRGSGPNNCSPYSLSVVGAVGNTRTNFTHRIESMNVRLAAGQAVTISGKIFSTDARAVAIALSYANTLDNFSASTVIGSMPAANTTAGSWVDFKATFTVPANAANGLALDIQWGAVGAGVNVAASAIQLEPGPSSGPFDYRPSGMELALCQRYFENASATLGQTTVYPAIAAWLAWKVTKRVNPTVTTIPDGGSGGVYTPYGSGGAYQSSANSAAFGATIYASAEL